MDSDVILEFRNISKQYPGATVIYISHRLEEIFEITDRISVLRDGKYIGTRNTGDLTQDELIRMMVGREIRDIFPAREEKAETGRRSGTRWRGTGRASG